MTQTTLPPRGASAARSPRYRRNRPGRRRTGPLVAWLVVTVSFGLAAALSVSWIASGPPLGGMPGAGGASGAGGTAGSPADSAGFGPDDGVIPDFEPVGIDSDVPAITGLDPALRDAVRQASDAASIDGQTIEVTSGWRSVRYQEDLFSQAVVTYGSEEAAREFVAPPTQSKHVTGDAVDIGPIDAQFWLMEHGADYGLCQTYANERWHFELATSPGGVCPEMSMDATGDWS